MNREQVNSVLSLARRFWTPRTGVIVHMTSPDGRHARPKYRLTLPGESRGAPGTGMVPGSGVLWAESAVVAAGDLKYLAQALGGVKCCLAYATNIYRSQDIPDDSTMCLCLRGAPARGCADTSCPLRRRTGNA